MQLTKQQRKTHLQSIFITGEIDEDTSLKFTRSLNKIHAESQQPFIPVYINSCGGCTYSMMTIVSLIESSEKPVYTICTGHAFSAAAVIFLSGAKRFMSKYATLMIHDLSISDLDGKVSSIVNESREMKRLNRLMYKIVRKHSKLKMKKKKEDHYISAKQALQYGITDHVGVPTFEISNCILEYKDKTLYSKNPIILPQSGGSASSSSSSSETEFVIAGSVDLPPPPPPSEEEENSKEVRPPFKRKRTKSPNPNPNPNPSNADLRIVSDLTGCSRKKARKRLREKKNNLVMACISLQNDRNNNKENNTKKIYFN